MPNFPALPFASHWRQRMERRQAVNIFDDLHGYGKQVPVLTAKPSPVQSQKTQANIEAARRLCSSIKINPAVLRAAKAGGHPSTTGR